MSEPYLVKPNFNHAPMDEDKKSFCRVGKHHDEIGCFTEVEKTINLMIAPSGSYILRPFDGTWTLNFEGVDIFEKYRDSSSRVKGTDYVTGLENYFSSNTTAILLLNDLEIHPEDTKKEYARRSGTIFNAENEMMTFTAYFVKGEITNNHIYILDDNTENLFKDIIDALKDKDRQHDEKDKEHDDAIAGLQNKDKEHDNAITSLQKKDKEHDISLNGLGGAVNILYNKNTEVVNSINILTQKDVNLEAKIHSVLKYFEETDDGNLQHIYEEFPLLYNEQYVKAVNPHIMVDPLAGIVYYDLRFLMKSGFPTSESVIIAKCPDDFMPQMSAPSSYTVRNHTIMDGEYYPVSNVTLKDGKGVFAFTSEENYGRVIVNAKDEVEENQFLYLSGSYFMKKANMGKQDLSKSLTEHGNFVKIDKLIGHGA